MEIFETRHVIIEAAQWLGENLKDANIFCEQNGFPKKFTFTIGSRKGMGGLIIPTLEGDHVAQKGDWIIRGLIGEYYPCKHEVFILKYQLKK